MRLWSLFPPSLVFCDSQRICGRSYLRGARPHLPAHMARDHGYMHKLEWSIRYCSPPVHNLALRFRNTRHVMGPLQGAHTYVLQPQFIQHSMRYSQRSHANECVAELNIVNTPQLPHPSCLESQRVSMAMRKAMLLKIRTSLRGCWTPSCCSSETQRQPPTPCPLPAVRLNAPTQRLDKNPKLRSARRAIASPTAADQPQP
jgi:hypothetical protein